MRPFTYKVSILRSAFTCNYLTVINSVLWDLSTKVGANAK